MVDPADIVSIVLRGALGRSGRKRARRARNFLSGHSGFLSASALMAAAGVAWGVYDSMKATTVAPGPVGSAPPAPPLPPLPAGAVVATADGPLPVEVLRLVRLAVSAARADGTLSPQERTLILERAREAGVEHIVESELAQSRPLTEIVAGVTDVTQRQELYVLAFTIVRADEGVTGAERIYLAQLAHHLGLDPPTVAALEQRTASAIDLTPEAQETQGAQGAQGAQGTQGAQDAQDVDGA